MVSLNMLCRFAKEVTDAATQPVSWQVLHIELAIRPLSKCVAHAELAGETSAVVWVHAPLC
jgi:hypothetical protein